jgi:hypothetical protein
MRLRLVVFVFDGMPIGQHALMQNTNNQDAAGFAEPVEDNMLAMFYPTQPWSNFITRPTERGIVDKHSAKGRELAQVTASLITPCAAGITADAQQSASARREKRNPATG